MVQNRPSKFDRIKAETETESPEIKEEKGRDGDQEDTEAPRKTFKEIQVSTHYPKQVDNSLRTRKYYFQVIPQQAKIFLQKSEKSNGVLTKEIC